MMTSSILSVSCQLKNVPLITEIDKMNNQKLSSSFEPLNSNNNDKDRSWSASPEITKFEEPGIFRSSAVKPEFALEWSNIQVKFRVVSQDFYSDNNLYDLYPDMDPQSPTYYQVDMRKNANSERLLTQEFLRKEGLQRYCLRDSSTSKDARNMSTKFLSR